MNEFVDYMGICVETGCKSLDQKLNSHICFGGGGGGSKTTSSTALDPDIKRRVTPALDAATKQYEAGIADTSKIVAGQEGVTNALAEQDTLSRAALEGTGVFDESAAIERDLMNTQGKLMGQQQGALGSARADKARMSMMADKSLQLQDRRQQQAAMGAQGLTGTAQQRRGLEQETLDAPHTALSRYFGYLGSAPQGSTTTQSGGGGGK